VKNVNVNLLIAIGAIIGVTVLAGPALGIIDPESKEGLVTLILGLLGGGALAVTHLRGGGGPPTT